MVLSSTQGASYLLQHYNFINIIPYMPEKYSQMYTCGVGNTSMHLFKLQRGQSDDPFFPWLFGRIFKYKPPAEYKFPKDYDNQKCTLEYLEKEIIPNLKSFENRHQLQLII